MSFIWEKSATWRWIVRSSRSSGKFYAGFAVLCFVGPWAAGELTMYLTGRNEELLREKLRATGREDAQLVSRMNKERLGQLLGEIQRKENTEDRYKAALRGETLTGTPDARVRAYGTTMDPVTAPTTTPPAVNASTTPANAAETTPKSKAH
eukprot:TRINITY_DN3060_c2_g3_i1.p1 TRINITY_DN3060_c2_g3~~TRINITY_DN3060_c2_g3_i1.p1  ORF type:complete len:151 (+),score=33.11 TRINITY_DN3060_c2_g3_i1:44-496(+)